MDKPKNKGGRENEYGYEKIPTIGVLGFNARLYELDYFSKTWCEKGFRNPPGCI